MADKLWDMSCRVTGSFELLCTLGGFDHKPTEDEQGDFRERCAYSYGQFFDGDQWTTAAVTVGPHRDEGDGDPDMG